MALNTTRITDSGIWLAGCIPDLPTPFDANDTIDTTAFARLCERQIDAGVPALVVGETSGESSTLTPAEHEVLARIAVEIANRRVLVIAGAGSNSTQQAIELTRRAEKAGADAVLSVVPYYNKPMQSGIEAHFQAIAASTTLPIILHDIPARTVRGLSDDTLARLANSPQFMGLRDGTGDATRVLRLRSMLPPAFRLLSGDDASALAFLTHGGDGCFSLASNIAPEQSQAVFRNFQQGRHAVARDLQSRLLPLISAVAKESPAVLKYALCLLGLCLPNVRLPMVELDQDAKAEMANLIAEISEIPLLAQYYRR